MFYKNIKIMKKVLIPFCLLMSFPVMLSAQSPNRFDVNRDNRVDISDIVAMINYIATGIDPAAAKPKTYTANGVQFQMVSVEGGTFQMGGDMNDNEKPVHEVKLNGFSIGQTEVTQELWEAVMGTNPSNWKGLKLPMERVSWNDCQTFITKLNSLTGQQFRLPTEAEWEYAARGGNQSKGYTYSGSDNLEDVAWYTSNSGSKTHEVATKSPNELGIYDMSGNVWEWCQDWYGSDYYSSSVTNNPKGPDSGSRRVGRGGCWGDDTWSCRVAGRSNGMPTGKGSNVGFRLAL